MPVTCVSTADGHGTGFKELPAMNGTPNGQANAARLTIKNHETKKVPHREPRPHELAPFGTF